MMNPSNPYADMLRQQMGPQGMGGGITPIQAQPLKQPERPKQEQAAPKSDGGGLLGGLLSDERSKKEIERLSSQNEALTRALDHSTGDPSGSMGGTEYPKMPADTRFRGSPSSHASFPDSPAANTVAAQNVALGASPPQAPPQQAQPMPQAPQRGAFNVSRGMPDLSALDEAYARIGREQGGG